MFPFVFLTTLWACFCPTAVSSINVIAGARWPVCAKSSRTWDAPTPTNISIKSLSEIEKKRTELNKLRALYYQPKKLPGEIKLQVAKRIESTKVDLEKLYTSPKDSVELKRVYKWGAVQVVKAFLGIPIIPGK